VSDAEVIFGLAPTLPQPPRENKPPFFLNLFQLLESKLSFLSRIFPFLRRTP
jgi:hypothetical protein